MPVDKLRRPDFMLAALAAVVTAALVTLFAIPGGTPEHWEEISCAVGLRPAAYRYPGIWRIFASSVFHSAGVHRGMAILTWMGIFSGAVMTFLSYFIFRDILVLGISQRVRYYNLFFTVFRMVVFTCAVLFGTSAGVWRLSEFFGPETALMVVSMLATALYFRFFTAGMDRPLWIVFISLGVLLVESPILALPVVFALMTHIVAGMFSENFMVGVVSSYGVFRRRWVFTFLFLIGAVAAYAADSQAVMSFFGIKIMSSGTGIVSAATQWLQSAGRLADAAGWSLAAITAIAPFAIAMLLFRRVADPAQYLSYGIGLFVLVSLAMALSQFLPVETLWFWNAMAMEMPSAGFVAVMQFFGALAVLMSLLAMAIELYCRNTHRMLNSSLNQIETVAFNLAEQERDDDASARRFMKFMRAFVMFAVLPAAMLFCLWGRYDGKRSEAFGIVRDYLEETVGELGETDVVFTDGRFDSGLEIKAMERGRRIAAVDLLSTGSDYLKAVNRRAAMDEEDRRMFAASPRCVAQEWMRAKTNCLARVSWQIGFADFARYGLVPPPCVGLVANRSLSEKDAASARERVDALEKRILEFYDKYGNAVTGDRLSGKYLECVQWRIARMLRLRSEEYNRGGDTERTKYALERSERLNRCNASWKSLVERSAVVSEQAGLAITPREGMRIAFDRADWRFGRRYAIPVVDSDKDNFEANFILGMAAMEDGLNTLAIMHLEKCLAKKPDDPEVKRRLAEAKAKTEEGE